LPDKPDFYFTFVVLLEYKSVGQSIFSMKDDKLALHITKFPCQQFYNPI